MQFYLAWIGIVRLMSEQCATTWLENVVGDLPRLLLAHTVPPFFWDWQLYFSVASMDFENRLTFESLE